MQKGLIWGAVAALSFTAPVFAKPMAGRQQPAGNGFSYNYIDAAYLITRNEVDSDDNSDGYGFRASLGSQNGLHLIGSYLKEDVDSGDQQKTYTVGGGLNFVVREDLDLELSVAYLSQTIDDDDDTGYQVGLDLRGRLSDKLELSGRLTYSGLKDGVDDTSPTIGLRFYFTDNLALLGDWQFLDGANRYFIGARFGLK